MTQKIDFLNFYLYKNIEVKIREVDQDPSDFGGGFVTYDDTFYIRLIDDAFDFVPDQSALKKDLKAQREALIFKFLEVLSATDHVSYQKLLLESLSVIPAETEEEEYRLRNVRLAEKGFMPFDEAVGIYQPLNLDDVNTQIPKFITTDAERKLFFPVPLYFTGAMREDSLFARTLKRIEPHDIIEQLQMEFAGICNRILSADQKIVREREDLKNIVQKACGYISIGLEGLAESDGVPDASQSATLIQRVPLTSIFRVGYGFALDLKWRAEKWRKRSWFEQEGLLISFWGEEWTGVLGGLLLKKPLFYDTATAGIFYREFISMEDIRRTEKVLAEIIAFDDLLSKMNVSLESLVAGLLTYKSLVLTLWARYHLGIDHKRLALSLNELKRFFDELWIAGDSWRKISQITREKFLAFLSEQTGQSREDISKQLGHNLENLFDELENEYGKVAREELDPRYIHHFLVSSIA
jgi:hypothetical protein